VRCLALLLLFSLREKKICKKKFLLFFRDSAKCRLFWHFCCLLATWALAGCLLPYLQETGYTPGLPLCEKKILSLAGKGPAPMAGCYLIFLLLFSLGSGCPLEFSVAYCEQKEALLFGCLSCGHACLLLPRKKKKKRRQNPA